MTVETEAQPRAGMNERLGAQVKAIVLKRLGDNTLNLPLPSPVVTRCLQAIRDPAMSVKDAAALVEQDPALAARVTRSANSAAHATLDRVRSIPQALTRIGMEKLRSILVELSAQRLFDSRDPRIAEALRKVWEHSLAVGMLARDVAALCNVPDSEAAYLAGLLHDVGKPVVAWGLLEAERALVGTRTNFWIEASAWTDVVQRVHRPVGVAVAERWSLPETASQAIADCTEYDSAERLSVTNCVRFANALAKREGLYLGEVDRDDVDALLMIGRSMLGIDENVMGRLTHRLRERLHVAESP